MSYRVRPDCRLCGGAELHTVLTLASAPPANEFKETAAAAQALERFPLYLVQCETCGHVQLPVVVDPERLFSNYVYVSGTSQAFVKHFSEYADWLNLDEGAFVVEIGSNDGTLLKALKERGARVLGIDPARAIAEKATAAGIQTVPQFFTLKLAKSLLGLHGRAKVVIANNVFAHADDLRDVAEGALSLLDEGGRFVFEVQYLPDMLAGGLFDMIYHEHLSYHTLGPLVRFFGSLDAKLVDAVSVPTHGGSVRCTVQRSGEQSANLRAMLDAEKVAEHDPWPKFKERIDDAGRALRGWIRERRGKSHRVVGYGAPAKLTTLCHEFDISIDDVACIVDDSPWKQGLYAPGTGMLVISPDTFARTIEADDDIDVVVFAWNFAKQIAAKLFGDGFEGRIVTPLPMLREFI